MIPSPQTKPPDSFALFVRAKEGHIVRRFGSSSNFGHTFVPGTSKDSPSEQRWDTQTVHAIPAQEYEAHRKEYEAELGPDGGLVRVERVAWEEQHKAHEAAKTRRKNLGTFLAKASETHAETLAKDFPDREPGSLSHDELIGWFAAKMPDLLPSDLLPPKAAEAPVAAPFEKALEETKAPVTAKPQKGGK